MPFCTQCGKQVDDSVRFCPGCGAAQSGGQASPPTPDFLANLSPRTASILCYVPWVGWIACVVVLATQRFRHERVTRFNAFQGLYLLVAWLLVDRALDPILRMLSGGSHGLGGLFKLAVIAGWVFMLAKTSQNQTYRLPVIGDLAERSLAEQRS